MSNTDCAKEGEEWHPFIAGIGYKSCCKGMVATSNWKATQGEKKCIPAPPGDKGFCIKCGDGKCDVKHFEDNCSCPKDCK